MKIISASRRREYICSNRPLASVLLFVTENTMVSYELVLHGLIKQGTKVHEVC